MSAIALLALGGLALLGCGGGSTSGAGSESSAIEQPPGQLAFDESTPGYGDDPALDVLWDACDQGDNLKCDELWAVAPVGSDYEMFAASCGGRRFDARNCVTP